GDVLTKSSNLASDHSQLNKRHFVLGGVFGSAYRKPLIERRATREFRQLPEKVLCINRCHCGPGAYPAGGYWGLVRTKFGAGRKRHGWHDYSFNLWGSARGRMIVEERVGGIHRELHAR